MPGCVLRVSGTEPNIPRDLLIEGARHRLSYSVSDSEHFAQQIEDAVAFLSKYSSYLGVKPVEHSELDFGVFANSAQFATQFAFPPQLIALAAHARITIKLSAYFGSD